MNNRIYYYLVEGECEEDPPEAFYFVSQDAEIIKMKNHKD